MVEGPRERNGPEETRSPERRFEADASAQRRRNADASSGVAAERGIGLAGDDGDRGSAGRPARYLRRVPRIANVAEVRVDRADPVGELVKAELAEEHRARFTKPTHDGRVLVGDPVREDPRACRRAGPLRREQVFDRDGYAV